MQEQVSKKPLVDILSAMMGSAVVMSEDKYVYLENKIEVSASELAEAIAEQEVEYNKAVQSSYVKAVDEHLDAKAREYNYDDVKTAVTYADEPSVASFQTEGQAFRAWRSLVYAHMYTEFSKIEAGIRTMPTIEEMIAELPALEL